MNTTKRKPFTPGEILSEEFMQPYGLTQEELAKRIHVTRRRINEIVNGRRAVTSDTALRLAKLFGTSPDYWLNLQIKLDLWLELHDKTVLHDLKEIKAIARAA